MKTTKELKDTLRNLETSVKVKGFATKDESDMIYEIEMELISRDEYTNYLNEIK